MKRDAGSVASGRALTVERMASMLTADNTLLVASLWIVALPTAPGLFWYCLARQGVLAWRVVPVSTHGPHPGAGGVRGSGDRR
jgi:hypothetical protein